MLPDFQNCNKALGFFILDLKTNFLLIHKDFPKFFFTNATGINILKALEETKDIEKVSKLLENRYNITHEQALKDVNQFLDLLKSSLPFQTVSPDKKQQIPEPDIKRLNVNLVSGCNLKCLHCGVPYVPGKVNCIDKKSMKKIIADFLDSDKKSIVFTGGEPMLHPDWLEILEFSQNFGRTIIASNCTLLKKNEIRRLAKMNIIMQISLESNNPEINDRMRGKGNFKKVKSVIKQLVDEGMGERIAICNTLTGFNADKLIEMIEFTKELGLSAFRLLPLQKLNTAVKNWNILQPSEKQLDIAYSNFYKKILKPRKDINIQGGIPGLYLNFGDKNMWCQIGSILNIDDEQNVHPCSLLMHEEFLLGNLKKDSLETFKNSEILKKLIKDCFNRKNTIPKCSKCAIRSICQSGCPGTVWNIHGNISQPDDLCNLRVKHFINLVTNFQLSGN